MEPTQSRNIISGEIVEELLDDLIQNAKNKGISDDCLAYILLSYGLRYYLKSFSKCSICPLNQPK